MNGSLGSSGGSVGLGSGQSGSVGGPRTEQEVQQLFERRTIDEARKIENNTRYGSLSLCFRSTNIEWVFMVCTLF